MSFRIARDESPVEALRRIAAHQVRRGLEELAEPSLGAATQIHQVRKRCKKLRGLLRLFRDSLGETYSLENSAIRELARGLSASRDAQVMLATYDDLRTRFSEQLAGPAYDALRSELTQFCQQRLEEDQHPPVAMDAAEHQLRELAQRIATWQLTGRRRNSKSAFATLAGGLAETYGRGLQGLQVAREAATPEAFHEWRKRVKYHAYHCRLLHNIWPAVLKCRAAAAMKLSDQLGADHDLAVLRGALEELATAQATTAEVETVVRLIDRRRQKLERKSFQAGERLYAETPKRLVRRFRAYWHAWRPT